MNDNNIVLPCAVTPNSNKSANSIFGKAVEGDYMSPGPVKPNKLTCFVLKFTSGNMWGPSPGILVGIRYGRDRHISLLFTTHRQAIIYISSRSCIEDMSGLAANQWGRL